MICLTLICQLFADTELDKREEVHGRRLWATTRDPYLSVELESMGLGASLRTAASAG